MTFLGEFVRYLKSRTDAPPDFHLHAGMAALSVAAGNHIYADGWARNIYPNLWTCVIAPSGMGKSVPLDMAAAVIDRAGLGARVLPESFSQEGLWEALRKEASGIFLLQEFSAFMGLLAREYNCVDAETEVLTRNGWKGQDALTIGEDVLTYQQDGLKSRLVWAPVQHIYRYGVVDEELLSFEGRTVSMLLTPNHRVVLAQREEVVRADSVRPKRDLIRQGGIWGGGAGRECANQHLAALIGWYVAEGWDDGPAIRIAQKSRTAELVRALSGYSPKRQPRGVANPDIREQRERRGMRWFSINGQTAANIRYWAPNKQIRWDALWRWPRRSLQALFEALIDGDGHRAAGRRNGVGCFTQLDEQRGGFYQALALRLGYRATGWTHPELGWSHYSTTRAVAASAPAPTPVRYTGTIWCPVTEHGTWVARRRGRVFVTGNSGAQSWLTSVFDVPLTDRRMLRGQTIELKLPCITILGASSPDWFAESFKASSLRGGFLARFLFCPSREPGAYVGHPGPRDEGLETVLADHLRQVSEQWGKADFSAVWPAFNAWDRRSRERVRQDCPPEFAGMRSRAGVLVLKSAMLFHLSRRPRDLRIEAEDLQNAIKFVERSHRLAEGYLSEEVPQDREEGERIKVLEILRRAEGRAPRSKVLKDSHLSARRLDAAVETLRQSERLEVAREGKSVYYVLPAGGGR